MNIKLLVIFCFLRSILGLKYEIETELIKHYAKLSNIPKRVVFYSCWDKKNSMNALKTFTNERCNVRITTDFSKVDFHLPKKTNTLIITSAKCPDLNILIKKAEELFLFQTPFQWLILNGTEHSLNLKKEILLNTNFAISVPNYQSQEIALKSIYKYSRNDSIFVENKLGVFKFGKGIYNYRPLVIARDRFNLRGAPVSAGLYFPTPESMVFDVSTYRRDDKYHQPKLFYVITHTIIKTLNATPINVIRSNWGQKLPNSTKFTGLFGALQDGTADFGGNCGFMSPERIDFVDFVGICASNNLKFVFRNPPLSNIENLFTLPFALNVWYAFYIIITLVVVCLLLIAFVENKYMALENDSNLMKIEPTLSDVMMVQIGAVTQQGYHAEPRSGAGRIAFFISFLTLLFAYTAYSAKIVVVLQSKSQSIKTVKDLLESKINLGVEDIIYNRYYFAMQTDPYRKALYEQKVAPPGKKPNFISPEEGIRRMRNEFFAFFFEGSFGYKSMHETFEEHQKCSLTSVEYLHMFSPSLSVQKFSPFNKILRVSSRKIMESGVHSKLTKELLYMKPPCIRSDNNFISVGINESYFAFVIFLIGIGLALLLLVLEILYVAMLKLWKPKFNVF